MDKEYWYRFEDQRYATCIDPDGDLWGRSIEVRLRRYKVVKTTKHGAWLDLGWNDLRFARRDARKRFACPTIEEAKESFVARKKRQRAIYEARVRDASDAIRRVEIGMYNLP